MKTTDLAAQLQQELNETIQQAKQIERQELNMLESDLKRQCSSASGTLKSGLEAAKIEISREIKTFRDDLKSQVSADSAELTNKLQALKTEVSEWTPKLIKTVKWAVALPVIATALACAATVGGTFAWWKVQNREHVHMRPFVTDKGETLMIVDEPTWLYCNEQTITDKNGKKVVYQQRCRKAD